MATSIADDRIGHLVLEIDGDNVPIASPSGEKWEKSEKSVVDFLFLLCSKNRKKTGGKLWEKVRKPVVQSIYIVLKSIY